jgi:hypothetical protein
MTEEAPVYAAALLLDPSRRAGYIRKNWPVGWIEPAIKDAHGLWDDKFKAMLVLDDLPPQLSMPPPAKPSRKRGAELDLLMKDMEVIPADLRDDDDSKRLWSLPLSELTVGLSSGGRVAKRNRGYPRLYHMAMAILSIPAESSEPERAFSGSRRTCSWDRLILSCYNIQRIECIGSWIREGHIQLSSLGGMGLPMEAIVVDEDSELGNEVMDDIEWI